MKTHHIKTQSGFVILFAILISTIILIMSAGIFNVAQKESILSSYSKQSQIAFYAADAGVECALYWDISPAIGGQTKFPMSLGSGEFTESFTCGVNQNGTPVQIQAYKYNASALFSDVFGFRYSNPNDDLGCSFVFVEKNSGILDLTGAVVTPASTRVTAVGYNVCNNNIPDLNDPTLLERRLSVSYSG